MKPAYDSPRVQTWPCLPCTQAHWSQKASSSSSCLQTSASLWQSDAWTKESHSSIGAGAFCHQLCKYLWKFKYGLESCWRRQWHPTPVLLPGKSHGRRSLVSCSPWGRYESDTTERLHFHFSLSCIEEGKGNPLQCSCLENPRDGGASWAAVNGVAQSRTRLKRLSSSNSSSREQINISFY